MDSRVEVMPVKGGGFVEQATIIHEGREFTNLGAAITPERIAVYVTGDGTATTWEGAVVGRVRVLSTWWRWTQHRRITMKAVRITLTDGSVYSGRYGSDWSQLVRAKRIH